MPAHFRWIAIVVGLLLFSVGTQVALITAAVSSPSFAVVPDYEERARNWDAIQQQRTRNTELAWTVDLSVAPLPEPGEAVVELALYDTWGKPIRDAVVELRCFHNARARRVNEARPPHLADGLYAEQMTLYPPGIWQFEIEIQRGEQRFTHSVRKSVAEMR